MNYSLISMNYHLIFRKFIKITIIINIIIFIYNNIMSNYGFIITRHVNSETTNRYWNQSVKLIRSFYPLRKIVIIDDNSDQNFIKADFDYKNLTIIQSEFPKRGELLPYYYYLKYKWFPNAIIMHDSLFIHKRIHFEHFLFPVLPLWHHDYDKENIHNILRLASGLTNNRFLIKKIHNKEEVVINLGFSNNKFNLCFGGQCYIKLKFLESLEHKYRISNLVNLVHNRTDRCALERILGLLFHEEYPNLIIIKSLFGDIFRSPMAFKYYYDTYDNDLKQKKIINPFVKVWTGR
jgi:hypothetical protein